MSLKKTLISVLVVLGVAFSTAGCGDSENDASKKTATTVKDRTTTTAKSAVPEGFKQLADDEAGFSVAIPEGWKEIDANSEDVQREVADFAKNNPALSSFSNQASQVFEQGGKLVAIDPSGAAFAANINIIFADRPASVKTADQLEAGAKQTQQQLGGTDMVAERLTISGKQAVKLSAKNAKLIPGATLTQIQIYILNGEELQIITFTTAAPETDLPTFEKIQKSYRIT